MQFYNYDTKVTVKRTRVSSESEFFKVPTAKPRKAVSKPPPPPLPPVKIDASLDTAFNPYLETPTPCSYRGNKVDFVEEGHRYTFVDEKGGYISDYVTSASALLSVWKAFHSLEDTGEGEELLSQAIRIAKDSSGGFRASQFDKTVCLVSTALVDYLNLITATPHDYIPKGSKYLSFQDRRKLFLEIQISDSKDFSGFVPHHVYRSIETWVVDGKPGFSPFDASTNHKDVSDLVWLLGGEVGLQQLVDQQLKQALTPFVDDRAPPTGADIRDLYGESASYGTAVHAYLEWRLTDPVMNTAEEGRLKFPCREAEDYDICDDFIAWTQQTGLKFDQLEARLGSYRHKICGSVDALRVNDAGETEVWDWKRSSKFDQFSWWWCPGKVKRATLKDCSFSGPGEVLLKYAIQLAVYRKLALLNGVTNVSDIGRLVIVHPAFGTWNIVEFDMNERTPHDKNGTLKGLGGYSPIEMVELMFQHHEAQLKRILGSH